MRHIILLALLVLHVGTVQAQFPAALQPPPQNSSPTPPLNLTIPPEHQARLQQPIQQMSSQGGPTKPGDQVRALRGTHIRSGPSEQSYSCGLLEPGAMVTVLEYPAPGSEYTPIAAPENCFSLIPESVIYVLFRPKTLFIQPQKTMSAVETLIDGTPPNGEYLASKYTLPKGSLVSVVNEKKIKVNGREKTYCVIRVGSKERRYVRTADLEGMADAAKAMQLQSPLNAGGSPSSSDYGNSRNTEPLYGSASEQQALHQQEALPAQLADQVHAAEQAYQTAMRYGAWEDARMRYQHLLQVDVLSVRILAKNRLEFISELQRNPPVVTTALSPQQGGNTYQPHNNTPWVPGGMVAARNSMPTSTASTPLPVKDVVIHSTPPPAAATAGAGTPASNSPVNIPLYSGTPGTAPAAVSTPPRQAVPTSVPTAQRTKASGRLNRTVQYDGINQLYYLTNSQLQATYFLRAVTTSNVRLGDYVNKYVEVEGIGFQAIIDGQTRPQINVERVKLLP